MRKRKYAPPFFALFWGQRTNGKQGKCGHTCYFCGPRGPQKRLLGSLPKPGTLGQVGSVDKVTYDHGLTG